MKIDYTYKDIHGMTTKELRSVLGRMNKEARKRAKRLQGKGYTGAMTKPKLKNVRGLKKVELEEAILDYAQRYLRNPRSTIKGMRSFESKLVKTLKDNTGLSIPRSQLDDFVEYLETIGEVWGSLRYPSKNALETYDEMDRAGITGAELGKAFKNYMKTKANDKNVAKTLEGKLLDFKEELEKANNDNKLVSANQVIKNLEDRKKKKDKRRNANGRY